MFLGEYRCSVDDKGRVNIPFRMRQELPQELILTAGLDKCLALYPHAEWERIAENLSQVVSGAQERGRYHLRRFYRNAVECTLDNQGRLMIPAPLREVSGIDREAVVAGMNTRIELWSPEALAVYDAGRTESMEKLIELADGLDFR